LGFHFCNGSDNFELRIRRCSSSENLARGLGAGAEITARGPEILVARDGGDGGKIASVLGKLGDRGVPRAFFESGGTAILGM
jgi:hypothetical protein